MIDEKLNLVCERCGLVQPLCEPGERGVKVSRLVELVDAFEKVHKDCKPGEGGA